jgi:SAM-dependent methyltransferase
VSVPEVNTDRHYLTEQQYATDHNLATRQSIYVFQRPRLDLYADTIDLARLTGDESVLDVGCGNGRYLDALRSRGHRGLVCGADLSEGMLRTAQREAGDGPLLMSDAQALPFASASIDVALVMHMLYHVPDRAKAIAEIRRIVRPGGVALVLTNSESHFRELDQLLIESAVATVGVSRVRGRASLTLFATEHGGAELEAAFADVRFHPFRSELVLDQVAPVVAYARSMSTWVVDDGRDRELVAMLDELERRVGETIAADGAFRITTACGCFVCR